MRRLLLAAGAVAILVAISGCDAADPRVTPAPTPSATPVFASDEEALAAAEAAYAAYLAVSDAISSDGGTNPERLTNYVTPQQLEKYVDEFNSLRAAGRHLTGSSTFDTVSLQRYDEEELAVYLCLDVSGVRVLDASDNDVTPAGRPERVPLEVVFQLGDPLLLQSSDVWDEASYCAV